MHGFAMPSSALCARRAEPVVVHADAAARLGPFMPVIFRFERISDMMPPPAAPRCCALLFFAAATPRAFMMLFAYTRYLRHAAADATPSRCRCAMYALRNMTPISLRICAMFARMRYAPRAAALRVIRY